MNATGKFKLTILAIAFSLVDGTANAQHGRWHSRPHGVVTVVCQPAVTAPIGNRFNPKERWAIAIAYLETHEYLTIKKYAQMTTLTLATAEAELDALARDKKKPVKVVIRGKKKVYVKK